MSPRKSAESASAQHPLREVVRLPKNRAFAGVLLLVAACSAGDDSGPARAHVATSSGSTSSPAGASNSGAAKPSQGGPSSQAGTGGTSAAATGGAPSVQGPTVLVVEPEDGPVLVVNPPVAPKVTPGDCDNELEVTYRDFTEAHEDFEMMSFSGDVVRLQLVADELGVDSKPVFRDSIGCPPTHDDPTLCDTSWKPTAATIHSAKSFSSWYNTVSGVNVELQKTLKLTETKAGSGVYVFDSNAFFPIEPKEGLGLSPKNGNQGKNFLFTTEIHLLFTYVAGQKFSFKGDDDLWIFVNNKLALDLGSMHRAESGEIDFDLKAAALGITAGHQYNMDVFHAERHTSSSNFRIETNIACFVPRPPLVF